MSVLVNKCSMNISIYSESELNFIAQTLNILLLSDITYFQICVDKLYKISHPKTATTTTK